MRAAGHKVAASFVLQCRRWSSSSSTSKLAWRDFVAAHAKGVARAWLEPTKRSLAVAWADGHRSDFSWRWLRDHCPEGYHSDTRQRQIDTASISAGLGVRAASAGEKELVVEWTGVADIPRSAFSFAWLREHCNSDAARGLRLHQLALGGACHRRLWGSELFSLPDAPVMDYDDAMRLGEGESFAGPSSGMAELMRLLATFGVALVRGTPRLPDKGGVVAFAERLGFVRLTLYGGVWATSAEGAEVAHNDTAYTNLELGSHTDCAYLIDPPGLQLFNCVETAVRGGESTYVDGFAVAERLRNEAPDAFEFFCRTPLQYFCHDRGCLYMASGPVFTLGAAGNVVAMRHNDYDRAPLDHLSSSDTARFYEHHAALSAAIRDPAAVARVLLAPGDMLVADNHRTMHGRAAFEGKRRMEGCYIARDELESRMRACGLWVPPERL